MRITTLPIVKDIWTKMRLRKILKAHQEVAAFWQPIIADYFAGNIRKETLKPQKEELVGKKIIWQYWGQGFDTSELPEVVNICLQSVEKYKGEYEIIRLSDETVKKYIDFPEYVWKKRENPEFSRTFFSDLLRLALLKTYGGVWLDATVLLTGELPEELSEMEHFVFQRDPNEAHKKYWESSYAYYWGWHPDYKVKILNSIIFAQKDSRVISILLDLMLYYWQTLDKIIDYFFFQILYQELISDKLADCKCPIVSDTIPHALISKIGGGYPFETYEGILQRTAVHKLTYKGVDVNSVRLIILGINR